MPFNLTFPQTVGSVTGALASNEPLTDISIDKGQSLFILGANGVGKSALMHRFFTAHHNNARWISAHRQTWLESNAVTLTGESRLNTEKNLRRSDTNLEARWMDHNAAARSSIAIYDLIDSENVRARAITKAVDKGDIDLAKNLSQKDAPIKIINELLRLSNLPIEISIWDSGQLMASKSGWYSIAQLSDGERNALLIAANVLTVEDGTLILIDEPERHLHRSIVSPFLTHLFAQRPECAFIVSTHDVMLPLDNPGSRTLIVRSCYFNMSSVHSWKTDLVPSDAEIDDDLKKDILGARRKLLFVEGTEKSLDKTLYSLIFPDVSVISKSSCRDVEHAVSGIREADTLHWVRAFGIVDNDRRASADIAALKDKGIYAISVFSVESIYYHPEIQRRIAERHATVTGEDAVVHLENAKTAALAAIRPQIKHLSERVAEKTVREEFFRNIPSKKDIAAAKPINVSIDIVTYVGAEQRSLQDAVDTGDLSAIIARYPVRETPALDAIASKLGFQNRAQYEGAVKKLLTDDAEALDFVKAFFGPLASDIASA